MKILKINKIKIGIYGPGRVGTACLFSLLHKNLNMEITLVGSGSEMARVERDDLCHSMAFLNDTNIQYGTIEALSDCDIVLISARRREAASAYLGKDGRAAETISNVQIVKQALNYISEDAKILIVSSPVDLLASVIIATGKFNPNNVIAVGTLIDTARFRILLSQKYNTPLQMIDAHVIGTHNEHMVHVWSEVKVEGQRVERDERIEIKTKRWGLDIARHKGSTWWGIAAGISQIIEALCGNEATLTVSSFQPQWGTCFSLPSKIGVAGIQTVMMPTLNADEITKIKTTVNRQKTLLAEISSSYLSCNKNVVSI